MASRSYDDLSKDELVRLLQARDRRDATRFGLVWEANEIERDAKLNADFVALDLDRDLSVGPEGPWKNLVIEGDNFDALRYLRMTFAGRVKCIYIDPPYNTGNRDFVYNDRFVEKDDLWRHSKWCEFMYQRLVLAKDLLREDGVIFVSIDDNEMPALALLMKRLFGENNWLACFVWQTDGNFDNQAKVKTCHEYVLAYARSLDQFKAPPVIDPAISRGSKLFNSEIKNTIVKNGPKNPVSSILLPVGFPAAIDSATIPARQHKWPKFSENLLISEGRLAQAVDMSSGWSSKELCEQFIKRDFAPVRDSKGQLTRFELSESGTIEAVKIRSDAQSHVISVIRGFGSTQSQSAALARIGIKFTYPKPVELIQYLVSMATEKDDLVLDFFAGSGTTAHAVLKLNAEDGGQRRFILVSNTEATDDEPTKNLCRDVCARRVGNVIRGYGDTPGTGGDFAYLRTRRIAPGRLLEIDHAQVWTALQLIHRETLAPFDPTAGLLVAGDEEQTLLYVPRLTKGLLPALRKAVEASRAVTLYSWQAEVLRQQVRAPHVQHEAIPETLARRFGLRGVA